MSDHLPEMPGPSTLPPDIRLRRLVAGWRTLQQRQPQQQRYRQLVRFGHREFPDVAVYRAKLRAAKLDASRVSAIGRILEDAKVTEAFLQAQNPLTFGLAVKRARENLNAKREATNDPAIPPEEKLQAEPAIDARVATLTCGPKLTQSWRQLKKLKPPASAWQMDCGLFELHFAPDAVAEPTEPATANTGAGSVPSSELNGRTRLLPLKLVIPISPETSEKLDRLAARSGINRSETASELLRRALHTLEAELATAAERKSTTGAGKSLQFGLQRRKNPARTIPDRRRLPVGLSPEELGYLTALGSGCGLSQNAIANLLLEPEARTRFARLQAARDTTARERQRTIVPDPFPDLSRPVVPPANG